MGTRIVGLGVLCLMVSACNCGGEGPMDSGTTGGGTSMSTTGGGQATGGGSSTGGGNAGGGSAGGGSTGGGVADAGPIDSGVVDAGLVDSGVVDSGTVDAGEVDAGTPDAGTMDAGTIDAGLPDSGFDAGPGFDDAGCPLPTGLVLDAADAGFPAAGLRLWLRADIGVALINGRVCRWEDVSGNQHHFTPISGMPAWVDGGIRTGPAVFFTAGTGMQNHSVLGIDAGSGRTYAAISRSVDTVTRFNALHTGREGDNGIWFGLDTNTFMTVGSREGVYCTHESFDSDLPTTTAVRSHIYSINTFTVGGPLPSVLTYAADGQVRPLTMRPGGAGNGTVLNFSGANITYLGLPSPNHGGTYLGDVLAYDHELSPTERAQLEAALQARYP